MPEKVKKAWPSRSVKASLSESYTSRIKPDAGMVVDHYDTRLNNLSLRVSPPSAKHPVGLLTWRFGFRYHGKQGILTLGRYPTWTADAALRKARKLQVMVDEGQDPRVVLRSRQAAAATAATPPAPVDTVAKMWARYAGTLDKKSTRHRQAVEAYFRRFILPAWADRSVHDVPRREISDLLEAATKANGPVTSNRLGTTISAFFGYMLKSGIITSSPATALLRNEEQPRERSLSVAELCRIWRAATALGSPEGRFVRLLIATATRLNEAARLPRVEIDFDHQEWLLPARRNKGRRDFVVMLSPLAMGVLDACPDTGPYMFSHSGRHPVSGLSRCKKELDAKIAALQEPGQAPLPPWTLHDIRRSVRTALSALKIDKHISEKVLNHATARLVRTYDRHEYAAEKRQALEIWGAHFAAALAGAPAVMPGAIPDIEERAAAE